MVDVVLQELEVAIRHALEVNHIDLTMSAKAAAKEWLDARNKLCPSLSFDAYWTYAGETFRDVAANVCYILTHSGKNSIALAVISAMSLP